MPVVLKQSKRKAPEESRPASVAPFDGPAKLGR